MKGHFFAAVLLGVIACSPVHAQGVQTGTITGVVQSTDTVPLPGVTVTASSPALPGAAHRHHRCERRLHHQGFAAGHLCGGFRARQFPAGQARGDPAESGRNR